MDVRLQSFAAALENFAYLANVDICALSATLDPRLIDGLQKRQSTEIPRYVGAVLEAPALTLAA